MLNNNKGFTLIELIVTALIINILAGVAIVAYIGIIEKSRKALVIRNASSAASEIQLWIDSSLSDKRHINELDTNFDGLINSDDKTNFELLHDDAFPDEPSSVAITYADGRNRVLRETSPWFNRPLWNTDEGPQPNGTIRLQQNMANSIRITATDKNGHLLYEQVISAN